jgi:hypothetical protein
MSELQTRLQKAAEEAARQGRTPGPGAAIRRGRQRRRRLIGGMVSVVALVLLAGTLGTGRLASRQPPVAPASPSTSTPTTTSVTRIPAAVDKAVKLEVQVHLGPSGLPDPFGMASDLSRVMQECEGGLAQVRMWAQVLGRPGCWPPRSRSQGGTGSAGRTASGAGPRGSLGTAGRRTGSSCCRPASSPRPSGARASWRWSAVPSPGRRCGCGSCSRTGRRSTWPLRRRCPVPGQVLRRHLPATSQDGLEGRARGRLRPGRPPHRRVLDHNTPG